MKQLFVICQVSSCFFGKDKTGDQDVSFIWFFHF